MGSWDRDVVEEGVYSQGLVLKLGGVELLLCICGVLLLGVQDVPILVVFSGAIFLCQNFGAFRLLGLLLGADRSEPDLLNFSDLLEVLLD